MSGNKRADSLAGTAAIDNNLTLDWPTVLQCVKQQLEDIRIQSSSHSLSRLKEKGVQVIEGVQSTLYKPPNSKITPDSEV